MKMIRIILIPSSNLINKKISNVKSQMNDFKNINYIKFQIIINLISNRFFFY